VAATADIWTEQDRLKPTLIASAVLHGGLFALLIFGGFLNRGRGEDWGGTIGGEGSAMSARMVATIPLPAKAENKNVLANESKGLTQSQPRVEEKAPEAIPIPAPNAKQAPKTRTPTQQKQPQPVEQASNVIPFGQGGQAGNMYSTFSSTLGTGGIGTPGGNFGSRYQWYVDAVRRRVSENWLRYEVDPRISNARRVYVTFDIRRDGSTDNVQLSESSGVPSLDQSAVNAIRRVDHFNPLPPDYSGSRVSVEFYFDYKR
jgi:periplasmic protein TonB